MGRRPVRAILVYFSQTGNTEKVAEAIAEGIREGGGEADLVRIEKLNAALLSHYDLIGIGSPVFYYKIPFNVEEVLRDLPELRGKFAFLFLTQGGHPANTFWRMSKILNQKGIPVIGAFECFGYDTFPAYIGTDRQKGHPDAQELSAARSFGKSLPARYERARSGDRRARTRFAKKWDKYHLRSLFLTRSMLKRVMPKKKLVIERCNRCGECFRRCPTGAISLQPFPIFNAKKCIYCYLCERICPQDAIKCDWSKIKKRLLKE